MVIEDSSNGNSDVWSLNHTQKPTFHIAFFCKSELESKFSRMYGILACTASFGHHSRVLAPSLHKLCTFPDLLLFFAKQYFDLMQVHVRSFEQLTNNFHAPFSLQARYWFHFYWWKAFHTWVHSQHSASFFESFVPEKNC